MDDVTMVKEHASADESIAVSDSSASDTYDAVSVDESPVAEVAEAQPLAEIVSEVSADDGEIVAETDTDMDTTNEPTSEVAEDSEPTEAVVEDAADVAESPDVEVVTNDAESEADGVEALGADMGQVIEALLFSTDSPISAGRLAELVGAGTPKVIREEVAALNEKYEQVNMSFRIEEIAGGFQMMTLADYRPWLSKMSKQRSKTRLSNAAMETLSIIAYKQPLIRAEIEAIRGVAAGDALNRLREMGVIKIAGRADIVGRPMLYATTKKFLDVFGLSSLDDLPPVESVMLKRGPEPEESEDVPAEPTEPVAASA